MKTQWTVQVRTGGEWVTKLETTRVAEAVRAYDALDGVKQLVRDGRPLPMLEQEDLFAEATA